MRPESTLPGGTLPSRLADIAVDDWDAMLCAVKDCLRLAVGEAMTVPLNGAAQIDTRRGDADALRAAEVDPRAAPAP